MNKGIFILLNLFAVLPVFGQYTMSINQDCDKNGKVSSASMRNGHEFVDLGLPSRTMWATCNLFAQNPGDKGDEFYWGALSSGGVSYAQQYVNTTSRKTLPSEMDAANSHWGYPWRIPTKAECDELLAYCTKEVVVLNSQSCYKFTSNVLGYADRYIYICFSTPYTWFSDTQKDVSHTTYWCGYKDLQSGSYILLNSLNEKKSPIRPVFSEKMQ